MVKIVILSLNTVELLKRCITAVRKYTQKGTYQLHIIDQGSDDGTVDYLNTWWKNKPDVQIETWPTNRGIYEAWNHAAFNLGKKDQSKAIHDVVFLGSDTEVRAGWLTELQELAYSNDRVGIVSSKLMKRDGGFIPGTRQPRHFVCFAGTTEQRGKEHVVGWEDEHPEFAINSTQNWVTFSCVYVKAKCLNQIGFFDTKMFCWSGDRDYCIRARQAGWQVWYCGNSRVLHQEGKTVSLLKGQDVRVIYQGKEQILPFSEIEKNDQDHFFSKWECFFGKQDE